MESDRGDGKRPIVISRLRTDEEMRGNDGIHQAKEGVM
jgi:hypothetical protein